MSTLLKAGVQLIRLKAKMFEGKICSTGGCLIPSDPLQSLMTANQMHIHSLINQLAANGFTYTTQNATDSLRDTHSFHFTQDFLGQM